MELNRALAAEVRGSKLKRLLDVLKTNEILQEDIDSEVETVRQENYEKRLQYPVKITQTNPKIAQIIISQFGGPDGELAASMRYLWVSFLIGKKLAGLLDFLSDEKVELVVSNNNRNGI